jgi:acetoin utilization deacetylase AcuC-like enzyme
VRAGIAADDSVLLHDTGPGHPERAARYSAVLSQLDREGLIAKCRRLPSYTASDVELALVHRPEYIALVDREVRQGRMELSTGDTTIGEGSLEAARAAAGSVIAAVDAVFERNVTNAFCLVRPPGHHASETRGMGFCLFNNIAIGARRAQKRFGAERVLIADWDVHHGNGTQDIFYQDGSVLFFSTHQYPWYPGTGAVSERGDGAGLGCTLNAPLPAGSGRKEVFEAFTGLLRPAAEKFRPDLILISAGFDSRIGDPLGQFLLTDADFQDLTVMLLDLAARFCDGRVVSVLEGGYDLDGLARASAAHVRALIGQAETK